VSGNRFVLFIDIAEPGEPPVWLRIGVGVMQPDGSLLARLDLLPTNGRVRCEGESVSPGPGPRLRRDPLAAVAPRAPGRVPAPPPLPARRRAIRGAEEEGSCSE